MKPPDPLRSCTNAAALLGLAVLSATVAATHAATPFKQATVTKVENRVDYGEVKGGRSQKRRAGVADVVRANNFLLTDTESRAELQYEDGSVVRIGQNTVFSFDADTRTLTLDKGSLIFYIPKGSGGGQVKTASLTAAITGTVGKVSENTIAILEGEVTLIPSGRKVSSGQFAQATASGIVIEPMDMTRAYEGKLMTFNGPMPGFDDVPSGPRLTLDMSQIDQLDTLDRVNNSPSGMDRYFPIDRPRREAKAPPPHARGGPGKDPGTVTPY